MKKWLKTVLFRVQNPLISKFFKIVISKPTFLRAFFDVCH